MSWHVCLAPTRWQEQDRLPGDILTVEDGPGPFGMDWASFTPPAELGGVPELLGRSPENEVPIAFAYKIKGTQTHLVIRGQPGLREAACTIVPPEALEDDPPLPAGVKPLTAGCFAGTLRWRKRDTFGGIPSRPVEGEFDYLRGQPTIDVKATNRRNSAIIDAQIDTDRAEVRRLEQERQKELGDALSSVQSGTRDTLPDLIAGFQVKAANDPAYTRLVVLAEQVLGDLLAG